MLDRTTRVIAYRLSRIRNADCIAVVDVGQVIEVGGHGEMPRRGGSYARLCSQQFDLPPEAWAAG